ncbi:hypothetical protein JD276_11395 [Leucobacter sp. CSA1]|uniref:DUF7882 domain-containing protein n=1 Tax=Leucobacter chromiisoli TaxID=2796471 RepID=A0A934QA96_9MICO|nr:hypothetical protein [Leucobacter chromiisoli]MBK0419637.1 hypothetical protein [Leucobacter chromiisoli]
MGTLIYGRSLKFEFDDRTLEHVKVVVLARFRKRESFLLSWTQRDARGKGSMSVWISPDIPLGFQFEGDARGPLSREWIEALTKLSYTNQGLVIVPERAIGSDHSHS